MDDMPTTTIAERITKARESMGLTQAELGRRIGVSRSAVWAWESGNTKGLTPENLVACADALGLNVRYLAIGEGPADRADTWPEYLRYWMELGERLSEEQRQKVRALFDSIDDQ